MRKLLAAALLLLAAPAFAQSVQQSAAVTAGHIPYWVTSGVIGDGGTGADSPITTIGVTATSGQGICTNSDRTSSPGWIGLCLGFIGGIPSVNVQNYGSAAAQPLQFIVNGVTYPFPGLLNVMTPGTTTVVSGTPNGLFYDNAGVLGNLATLNSGVLVTSGTGVPSISKTLPSGLTILGSTTLGANGGSAGQIIANGATSGSATVTPQAAAGAAALLWPTTSGTLASSGTSPITVDAVTGAIGCATCNVTGSNVGSVSNSDGSLTISPTVGSVVASLNLGHSNTWTVGQTFSAAITYGGVTLSNAVTGTGNMVLSAAPTFTGAPILAAPSATTLIVGSSTTLPSPAVLVATANSTTLPNPPSGTVLQVGGANGVASPGVVMDGFAGGPTMTFRRADTTAASPSAVQSGEVLMNFGATGFGATVYSTSNRLQIVGKATEAWSDTAQGTSIQFNTTPNGTAAAALSLIIQNSGGVGVGTATDPGIGAILANTSVKATTTVTAVTGYLINTKVAWSATAPTVSSGFCTSPSISNNNGTAAFTITIGSACAASTGVLTMPTASVGWACHFNDVTTPASNTPYQTASTTGSVSVTNYARTTGLASNWTASEVITAECTAY